MSRNGKKSKQNISKSNTVIYKKNNTELPVGFILGTQDSFNIRNQRCSSPYQNNTQNP